MPKAYITLRKQYITFPTEIFHFPFRDTITGHCENRFSQCPLGCPLLKSFDRREGSLTLPCECHPVTGQTPAVRHRAQSGYLRFLTGSVTHCPPGLPGTEPSPQQGTPSPSPIRIPSFPDRVRNALPTGASRHGAFPTAGNPVTERNQDTFVS